MIDLRSDTVTLPSPAMRRAMAAAEVGDDVFGEDPTVRALETRAEELLGKAAALFVVSGTMGNLVSLMAHLGRGTELIAGAGTHVVDGEAGGHAVVAGASARAVRPDADGTIPLRSIRRAFRDRSDVHEAPTGLVVLENTHNLSMGQPLTPEYTAAVAALAHDRGVPLHVDGARIFNAAVALGVPVSALAEPADSLTFCLSKSLACPVGSLVVGEPEFIDRARRARKMVGGGMRQAGVLAAAGLVALRAGPEGMIDRLADDHEHARILAEELADLPGVVGLDPSRVRTNFVLFGVAGGGRAPSVARRAAFLEHLAGLGVRMIEYPDAMIRAVTHYGIERRDVRAAVVAARAALAATERPGTRRGTAAHGTTAGPRGGGGPPA